MYTTRCYSDARFAQVTLQSALLEPFVGLLEALSATEIPGKPHYGAAKVSWAAVCQFVCV